MNPSHCSAIVFSQPAPVPFVVEAETTHTLDSEPTFVSLLRSVFGQVFVHGRHADALTQVKQLEHTLLIIDLDSIVAGSADNDDDDHAIIYTPASSSFSSSSCSTPSSFCSALTATSDPRLYWVRKSAQFLDDSGVPIIVCSARDDTMLMLDCIHAGATDYLLKPLHLDVIKTLFLKLHRCRTDSKMHEASSLPVFLQPPPSLEPALSAASTLCPEDALQHRIQEMVLKSTRFTQVVMDMYTQSLTEHVPHRNLSGERATFLKHHISSWDFYPFQLPVIDLVHCAYLIFEQALALPGLYELGITQDRLYDFILDLSGAYYDGNPYHNFAHAVDVLQCLYFFLCRLGLLPFANGSQKGNESSTTTTFVHPLSAAAAGTIQQKPQDLLRPQDIFALLIAAIGHDAAHPGVNNVFLVNSGSPLAMLYGDRSVLENFHSMTLFQIIHKHGLDQIGGGPGSPQYQEFRKTVMTTILATDMSLHGDYINKIHSFAAGHGNDREQERLVLCSAIIKCADISNVTRPFLRAAKWAELLIEECVSQGDLERAMGLPSVPMNDRDSVVIEDSQIGFIRFVAIELFESVSRMLPEMDFTVDHIHDNLKEWERRKKAESHDSGVASLEELSSSSLTTATINGSGSLKRHGSSSSSTTPAAAASVVDVFRKRLSIDQEHHVARRRSSAGSVTEVLLAMPAFARMDHEDYLPPPQQPPPPPPPYNAVFCQCCIQ